MSGNHKRLEILLQWKDDSSTYKFMKDMKEYYPVQLAEYAHLQHIVQDQYLLEKCLTHSEKEEWSNLNTGLGLANMVFRYLSWFRKPRRLIDRIETPYGGIPFGRK
eukprot:15364551-Ditylum_brightwellii.AAC.1